MAAERPAAIEEVLVTAQKRTQSTLDVGVNVTVIDAEALRQRRMEQISEIAAFSSNISIKENMPGILPVVSVRGVGLNDFSATNNPSAGIYVDEVYLSSLALMNFDLFDLERVEALKGPQGTLYGRNSTAGAINIITARPDPSSAAGRFEASYGNHESADLSGFVNVPVGEAAALRASAKVVRQNEGWFDNRLSGRDVGERRVYLGRLQGLVQPNERLEAILKLEAQRVRSEIGAGEFFGLLPPPTPVPGLVCPGSPQCTDFFGYSDTDGDPFTGSWSEDPSYDVDQHAATLRVVAELDWATLTSVTGYVEFDRTWGADTDAGPLRQTDFVENDDISQYSQELRLDGERGMLSWLVGAFYSNDDVQGSYDGSLQDLFNTTSLTTWDQQTASAAAFAHGEWQVSDTVSLITGLRYTWEEKDNESATLDLVSECPVSFLTLAPCGSGPIALAVVDDTIDDTNWSWKGGVNFRPTETLLLYASISKGVKSGGFFSGVATSSRQLLPYAPESLIAYEIGTKWLARDLGLQVSASAFYYDYSDVQTFIRDESGGLPIQRLGNVDDAKIEGIDLEIAYQPPALPGLFVGIGLGLLDTELGGFESSAGAVPRGNELPDAPEVSATLQIAYERALSNEWALRAAVDGRYTDQAFKDALNDPIIAVDAFDVWNARISLFLGEDWEFSVWGKNVLDEEYVTQGVNNLPLGVGFRVYGPPRTYGLSATRHF